MFEGLIALLSAAFIGGALSPLFVKVGISEFPPLLFTVLRFVIATLLFFPVFLVVSRDKLKIRDIKILSIGSLFFALNVSLYAIGLQFTTAIISQILYTFVPLLVAIFAYFISHEKLTRYKIIGGIIAFSGAIFLFERSFTTQESNSFGNPIGNIIIACAVVCWSLYLAFSKNLTNRYSPVTTTFFSFLLTLVIVIFLIPIELLFRPFHIEDVTIVGIGSLLGVGIISSIIYFFLVQYGVKKTSSFTASLFSYFAPLFSAITAVPLLHEKITPDLIVGGLLIILGVFYATTLQELIVKNKSMLKWIYGKNKNS